MLLNYLFLLFGPFSIDFLILLYISLLSPFNLPTHVISFHPPVLTIRKYTLQLLVISSIQLKILSRIFLQHKYNCTPTLFLTISHTHYFHPALFLPKSLIITVLISFSSSSNHPHYSLKSINDLSLKNHWTN